MRPRPPALLPGSICSSKRACPCIFISRKANTQRITSLQVANDKESWWEHWSGRDDRCGESPAVSLRWTDVEFSTCRRDTPLLPTPPKRVTPKVPLTKAVLLDTLATEKEVSSRKYIINMVITQRNNFEVREEILRAQRSLNTSL